VRVVYGKIRLTKKKMENLYLARLRQKKSKASLSREQRWSEGQIGKEQCSGSRSDEPKTLKAPSPKGAKKE